MRGFRRAIIGLAIAGIAAAWLWQIDSILVLSLVIGGEELLESTMHIQALGMPDPQSASTQPPDPDSAPQGPTAVARRWVRVGSGAGLVGAAVP